MVSYNLVVSKGHGKLKKVTEVSFLCLKIIFFHMSEKMMPRTCFSYIFNENIDFFDAVSSCSR